MSQNMETTIKENDREKTDLYLEESDSIFDAIADIKIDWSKENYFIFLPKEYKNA